MIKPEIKDLVKSLHKVGKSQRYISESLKLSRNSVHSILHEAKNDEPLIKDLDKELVNKIKSLLSSCRGNLVRVHEILTTEHNESLAYSSLTYLVRKYDLQNKKKPRVGIFTFECGEEMQHDTSPHWLEIAGKKIKAQCASLVLAFSRRTFAQYYPCFTRFEAKAFLQQAIEFMNGSCRKCIIDNTSVILVAGAGEYARVAEDMKIFEKLYEFKFAAHDVNRPSRKYHVAYCTSCN